MNASCDCVTQTPKAASGLPANATNKLGNLLNQSLFVYDIRCTSRPNVQMNLSPFLLRCPLFSSAGRNFADMLLADAR